jgi:hypothetical protein
MSLRLAAYLHQAQLHLYRQATTRDFRAAVAMARIFHDTNPKSRFASRRVKKAYSDRDLTVAINQMIAREGVNKRLTEEGHDPIPSDINWGRVILLHAKKYARVAKVDINDFVGELFADMLAGQRGRSVRETGSWRNNIIGEIEEWGRQDYNKARMVKTLAQFTKNKAYNMMRTEQVRLNPDTGFDSGDAPEGGAAGGGRLFESLFTLDGITKSMMGNWMSLSRRNPVLTDLVNKVEEKLSKRDDEYAFIFNAYMQDPSAPLSELLDTVIMAKDPETGARGRMPLWHALGFPENDSSGARNSNKANLSYRVKKMRAILNNMFPEVESFLRDLSIR